MMNMITKVGELVSTVRKVNATLSIVSKVNGLLNNDTMCPCID